MASRSADTWAPTLSDATDATRRTSGRAHFPCFEGLRALAAAAVVVFHGATAVGPRSLGPLSTPVGFLDLGVAVFFAISGFLLYRPFVLAHQLGRPPVGLMRFWWRRLIRIVPAYWAALSILWATGLVQMGDQWWKSYLFIQIYDAFTILQGIIPAWSLNTEMAFYVFIPLWALAVRRIGGSTYRPRLELGGALALFLTGYVSRAVMSSSSRVWAIDPDGDIVTMREISFAWLPNMIDMFALGMVLAVLSVGGVVARSRLEAVARRAWPWWTAALVIWLGYSYGIADPNRYDIYEGLSWQLRQLAFGSVGLCLLVPAVFGPQDHGVIRRVLQFRPVVWVGVVSYGLYLWHYDLIYQLPAWLDRAGPDVPVALSIGAGFGLGLAAATASWYLLEQPLARVSRRGWGRAPRRAA